MLGFRFCGRANLKIMPKKIKLELTEKQFKAAVSMIEENAILAGGSDDEFRDSVNKKIRLINRMFKANGIDIQIRY